MQNKVVKAVLNRFNSTHWVFFFIALALLPFMVSSQSLWIDEAYNARFARLGSFEDFIHAFLAGTYSENQMPFGMFYSWIGGRAFGTSELSLRAVNLLWGVIGVTAFYKLGKRFGMSWLPLLFATQPFLWFYMNEARPYAMQIAGGALLLVAIVKMYDNPAEELAWLPSFAIGTFVLCGSSLLGTIPFMFIFAVACAIAIQRRYVPSFCGWISLGLLAGLLSLLAAFYIWTLLRGAGGAKMWPVGVSNIAFSFYDMLGFSGLGPSRSDLRALAVGGFGPLIKLMAGSFPALASLAALYCFAFVSFFRRKVFLQRPAAMAIFIIAGSFFCMTAASILVAFPFWSRHLAGIFPFMVFLIGLAIQAISPGKAPWKHVCLVLIIGMLLFSSFNLRFNAAYSKDDYRSAAAIARKAMENNGIVWWAADPVGANYYGLFPATSDSQSGSAFLASNLSPGNLASVPRPDVIALSKVDIYDHAGALQAWIAENQFILTDSFPAFRIFSKGQSPH